MAGLVELPDDICSKLGQAASRIVGSLIDGFNREPKQRTGEITIRFGLTFTGSLDVKIIGASAEATVVVELKCLASEREP